MNTFLAISKIFASVSFTWGKKWACIHQCWASQLLKKLQHLDYSGLYKCDDCPGLYDDSTDDKPYTHPHQFWWWPHLRLFIEPQVFETENCFLEDFQSVCISSSCFFVLQLESWLSLKVMTASDVWNWELCCSGDFQSDWVSSSALLFYNWSVDLT